MTSRTRRLWLLTCGVSVLAACKAPDAAVVDLPNGPAAQAARKDEPPVAVNADVPVDYPPALYQQGIEGRVLLRLYADSTGAIVRDSTRVAESSGYPAFDSAAVAAVPRLRFAPGRRDGVNIGMSFSQPIVFKHPQSAGVTP
ncbi:MAG TPA: energy transducer TonB [Gemmatimonadales bacterium]|nr:energy transducer TonB [Gemmatimonadales bacterium]